MSCCCKKTIKEDDNFENFSMQVEDIDSNLIKQLDRIEEKISQLEETISERFW